MSHSEYPLVVAEAWARYGQANVLIVDWRAHATYFYTKSATRQIFKVADTILDFLEHIRIRRGAVEPQQIRDFYKQIHGAGHSLGAQIMGILGNKIRKKHNDFMRNKEPDILLGRIYGLDPAGFWFHDYYGKVYPEGFEYLSEESAHLVIVLHTTHDSKYRPIKMGLRYVIGHYDFYVYVAEGLDEWCPSYGIDDKCEHVLAPNLFKAAMEPTVNREHSMIGFKCHDLVTNELGESYVRNQETAVFGLEEPTGPRGNAYYLPISNQSPYNYVRLKASRNMKRCEITTNVHPDHKTKRQIKDIRFVSETDINAWWGKCKQATPSPHPITIEWDHQRQVYKNVERISSQTIGGR